MNNSFTLINFANIVNWIAIADKNIWICQQIEKKMEEIEKQQEEEIRPIRESSFNNLAFLFCNLVFQKKSINKLIRIFNILEKTSSFVSDNVNIVL